MAYKDDFGQSGFIDLSNHLVDTTSNGDPRERNR
jgi:hypothetical protein